MKIRDNFWIYYHGNTECIISRTSANRYNLKYGSKFYIHIKGKTLIKMVPEVNGL